MPSTMTDIWTSDGHGGTALRSHMWFCSWYCYCNILLEQMTSMFVISFSATQGLSEDGPNCHNSLEESAQCDR